MSPAAADASRAAYARIAAAVAGDGPLPASASRPPPVAPGSRDEDDPFYKTLLAGHGAPHLQAQTGDTNFNSASLSPASTTSGLQQLGGQRCTAPAVGAYARSSTCMRSICNPAEAAMDSGCS